MVRVGDCIDSSEVDTLGVSVPDRFGSIAGSPPPRVPAGPWELWVLRTIPPKTVTAAARDREDLDALFDATYAELRRLASAVRRGDPSHTLNPTALVHEVWIKLAASPEIASTSRLHFKRIAARAMRQVLVEAARRRKAAKRGGADAVFVTFDDQLHANPSTADDLLGLDEALEVLARVEPRQAMIVESRFFAGLDVAETAELVGVSEATILRDWRAARAWLAAELRRPQ
jgi:RNA polymerase sigma factor (TIGR02999 family)